MTAAEGKEEAVVDEAIGTGVDHVHVPPPKTGHRLVDLSIALSAITISLISLFVAIEHGVTERQLVSANSWPYVEVGRVEGAADGDKRFITTTLTNKGVGPAQVEAIYVTLDGKPVRSLSELLRACCGVQHVGPADLIKLGLRSTSEPVGVLAARDQIDLMDWHETPDHEELWTRLEPALRRLRTRVTYCSVLDECWTSDSRTSRRPSKGVKPSQIADSFAPTS